MGANFPGASNCIPWGSGCVITGGAVPEFEFIANEELPHELEPARKPHIEKTLAAKMGEWLKIDPERISVELEKTVIEKRAEIFETFRAKVTEVKIDGKDLNKRQEAVCSLVLEDSFFPIKE
jgi:hypothetical protein